MRASQWEFENRAIVIGALFGIAFALSALDRRNMAVTVAATIAARIPVDADRIARAIFASAAALAAVAALLRTWASAVLSSDVVYADRVKTTALVADGPYRFVRNPLYLANVLLALGMGMMASRLGFVVLNALMLLFSYRLILREEAALAAAQGGAYAAYRARVPRLLPALSPRIPDARHAPHWAMGVRTELWYWGFAAAIAVFAATLSVPAFFVILGASIATLFFQ